jgi:hypothetical protein
MRTEGLVGILGFVLMACGSSASTGTVSDGGLSNDGGTTGCPQPAPALSCATCTGGTTGPECENGTWQCPPLPGCGVVLDAGTLRLDAGGDAQSDAGDGGDASSACLGCDLSTSYCEISYGPPQSDGGSAVTDSCLALPACDTGVSCDCVSYGPFCTCTDDGGDITVTCPFHV